MSHTGFGVVEVDQRGRLTHVTSGSIYTSSHAPFVDRLLKIHLNIEILVKEFRPEHFALERVFFAKNARSALELGHARGAVLLSAGLAGIPVFEYAATEAKKAVCTYGGADKKQVSTMVRALLGLTDEMPDHATDALAICICHAHSFRAFQAVAPARGRVRTAAQGASGRQIRSARGST